MADDRISMPSSFGGIVRYFDEYKSSIRLKPAHVILIIVLVIVLEVALRIF